MQFPDGLPFLVFGNMAEIPVLERPAHDPVSVRSVGSVRRRAVVGFADHEDTRAGVGVAVPHVGEEMDGLGFLQMLPERVRSYGRVPV